MAKFSLNKKFKVASHSPVLKTSDFLHLLKAHAFIVHTEKIKEMETTQKSQFPENLRLDRWV